MPAAFPHPASLATQRRLATQAAQYRAQVSRADSDAPDLANGGVARGDVAPIGDPVPCRVLASTLRAPATFAGAPMPTDAFRLGFAPGTDVRPGDHVALWPIDAPEDADPTQVVRVLAVAPLDATAVERLALVEPARAGQPAGA
jgi:hypothetical protein